MHSVTLDSSGSPRKRTFSRGLSEDESLRSIIKETESSSRRLARSDSRAGTLKRRSDSQSDQDLFMGLPEMLELQASYDEVVQELRGLEVEREALLFQVDVLQDTLEGVEELLAEAQREAGQASLELEREREAKRKLESMVSSLMQEVERLKEEQSRAARTEEKDSSLCEPHSSESRRRGSEEAEQDEGAEDEGGVLTKLRKMVNKPLCHIPSLALDNPLSEDGVHQRPYENCIDDGRDPSPDRNDSDDVSAYEDASAETPEHDRSFPGDGDPLELPIDSENKEKSPTNNCQGNDGETQEPKNPDSCVVS
ncbi:leucine-rich repeat flightless-interacting protein 2-like isoform X2 [Lates japonicus]|uniref:Leucine-rich repeat flightless-interacting protein 2-like isoform X2 n=1 Tax=Lates japonicus TaxID=270547 RepID=A0AAD3MYU3_LATJO|nr:leucine-rich repeat flightless-interacting protein 2-like isoform X2 [Lates japonicus]